MKLHCENWGPRLGPQGAIEKIIFLHGLGGTGSLWRPIAATLEDDFAILAPDQRGHGKSQVPFGNPQVYAPLDFGKDLEETLHDSSFWPAWVVGHSMGVRSACALAHLRPDFVKGLILVDLGLVGAAGGGLHQDLHSFLRIIPDSFPNREAARQFMTQNSPDPSIGQYLMAVSVRLPDGSVRFPFDRSALIHTLEQARDVELRPWIRAYAERGKPVLLVRGESSRVWSHEEFEAERLHFADLASIRFVEIPDTGHGLPFEKRREFTAELLNEIRYRQPPPG